MIERLHRGELPAKHHIVFRSADGQLRHEECLTRVGFDGPYTLAYHVNRPQSQRIAPATHGWGLPVAVPPQPLARRHYRTGGLDAVGGPPIDARQPLLFNRDVVISILHPTEEDPVYFVNGDADELFFVFEGGGLLRTMLGDVPFGKDDYVGIPKGIPYRFVPDPGMKQFWLAIEGHDLHLPSQWRTATGQLRMDAPFCHRDFRAPAFSGPLDEGIRDVVVKRNGAFHGFIADANPFDVVGWDGSVYPFVFPILNFQPRAGLVHLPPDWHGNFAIRGGLICSFVPRVVDFHPQAIPCPYPHSAVDCDEFLFYARGNFTSRRGVGPGSVSFHPAGVPHGPHPGAYEGSIGARTTDELAVMIDTFQPLSPTAAALGVEDPGYHDSFRA